MESLDKIPQEEKEHYAKCSVCNQYFDCRDLTEVVDHFHEDFEKAKFHSSRKINEPTEYIGRFSFVQN